MIGIYKITSPTGRIYIGQSNDIKNRWYKYQVLSCKDQPAIYNSLKKYGVDTHIFEIIEECELSLLSERERYWQEYFNSVENGLNCKYVATEDKTGFHSAETKLKQGIGIKKYLEDHIYHWVGKKHKSSTIEKMKDNNARKRIILDTQTGVFYFSIGEASEALCVPYYRLRAWLQGVVKNQSNLIYC